MILASTTFNNIRSKQTLYWRSVSISKSKLSESSLALTQNWRANASKTTWEFVINVMWNKYNMSKYWIRPGQRPAGPQCSVGICNTRPGWTPPRPRTSPTQSNQRMKVPNLEIDLNVKQILDSLEMSKLQVFTFPWRREAIRFNISFLKL